MILEPESVPGKAAGTAGVPDPTVPGDSEARGWGGLHIIGSPAHSHSKCAFMTGPLHVFKDGIN